MSKRVIPVVDLSKFTEGDENSRTQFVKDLGYAFHEVGFVGVVNHGIPKSLVDNFYTASKAFFALPKDIKRKYEVAGLAGQRGYTSFGKEHAKQSKVADLKEFYQFGQEVEDIDPLRSVYPHNVDVEEKPEFLALAIELYRSF
ncbi:MAG: 2-oxoglutarate and iron-dependent oxygenase domain-containing protein, partial [Bacteroidota bacterium]